MPFHQQKNRGPTEEAESKLEANFLSEVGPWVCVYVFGPETRLLSMQNDPNRHPSQKRGVCDLRFRVRFFTNDCVLGELYALYLSQKFRALQFAAGLAIGCPLCVECLLRDLLALSAPFAAPRRTTKPRGP